MELKTIKTGRVLMASAALLLVPSAFGQQLYITAPEYNGANGNGDQAGPYDIQIKSPAITGLYVGADTIGVASGYSQAFQTFCIASTVDYAPDNTYYYQVSSAVQPFAGETPQGVLPYVAWGTAYLYNCFLKNPNNSLFGGITPAAGSAANAADDALQEAIWTFQGQSFSGLTLGGNKLTGSAYTTYMSEVSSDLTADLNAAYTAAGSQALADANGHGVYGVEALNMSTSSGLNGDWVQPQLVEIGNGSQGGTVPEPSTVFAAALMLLPLGVSAVRIMRKNRVS
jgi:hypothetical protein